MSNPSKPTEYTCAGCAALGARVAELESRIERMEVHGTRLSRIGEAELLAGISLG